MRRVCLLRKSDLKYYKRNSLYNFKRISSSKLYYIHHKQNRLCKTFYSRLKGFQKYIDMVEDGESGQGIDI